MEFGVGLVRSTSFGRKRVALSSACSEIDGFCDDYFPSNKRTCFKDSFTAEEKMTTIEDLPQEMLVRIICELDHDDLKSLFLVSKATREATLLAKQSHFTYSTPRKTLSFKSMVDIDDPDEAEAPNAPKQSRIRRPRLSPKRLASISVNLFGTKNEVGW